MGTLKKTLAAPKKLVFGLQNTLSAAFALTLLFFGAAALFNPIETGLFWGQSALGAINVLFWVIVCLSQLLYSFFPRLTQKIKSAADILLALSLVWLFAVACAKSGTRQESWFLALNWLLVNHGQVFGATLGLAVASLTGAGRLLRRSPARANNVMLPCVISFFGCFSAFVFGAWKAESVFMLLAIPTALSLLLAVPAAFGLFKPKCRQCEPKINRLSGVVNSLFLLLFASAGIYGLIDKSEVIFYPGAPLPGTVRIFEILIIGLAVAYLLATAYVSKHELKAVRRLNAEQKGLEGKKAKRAAWYPLRALQSVGLVFGFGTVLYYFPIVIRLPGHMELCGLFVAVGALCYALLMKLGGRLGRTDLIAKLCKLAGLGMFAVLLVLLMQDQSTNGVQYGGYVTGDDYFPFKFIHSVGHAALAGLSLGVFLCDEILYRVGRASSAAAPVSSLAGMGLGLFSLGIVLVSFPHAITLLDGAGEWPPTYGFKVPIGEDGVLFGHFFPWVFGGLLALGVLAELLFSLWYARKDKEEIRRAAKKCTRAKRGTRRLLSCALALVIMLGGGGFALGSALSGDASFVRENVGSGADIYATDSYERVSPHAAIRDASGKDVDGKAAISVAGNEYGAVQLVWKTGTQALTKLNGTVTITDSNGKALAQDKGFTELTLRKAKNIYGGEYPEILEPLADAVLPAEENSTIWFSFFTDYDLAAGEYQAQISFDFVRGGTADKATVLVDISVAEYSLPKRTHTLYNLPYDEGEFSTEYYAKRRQFMDGIMQLTEVLTSTDRWYDYEKQEWDFSRPLNEDKTAEIKREWGYDVKTGEELWNTILDVSEHLINDLGQPMLRADYLTVLVRGNTGIGNPENWTDDEWTGKAWEASERKIAYDFYYYMNAKFLSRTLPDGSSLASRVCLKWKDEFEQPQFFPDTPDGRTLGREELYTIYALELQAMVQARADAQLELFISERSGDFGTREELLAAYDKAYAAAPERYAGVSYLANCDPTAENFDILFEYFDIYCPLSYRVTDALLEKCREAGKRVWQYTCCQPFLPYANQFGYNQTLETHITQWTNFKYGMEGYWLWRSDYRNPANFYYGFTGWLDGVFVYYPTGEKPELITEGSFNTGIRFESATDSVEELELFIMYENSLYFLEEKGLLSAQEAQERLAELTRLVDGAVSSPYDWTTDTDYMNGVVRTVRDELSQLYARAGFASVMDEAFELDWVRNAA
ncbi:MAG: hypothetical protein LBQ80_05605 [Clostridium sp.]|jgi:hypothetical protein|nr:hypothetical protein [Clostridium sp.]